MPQDTRCCSANLAAADHKPDANAAAPADCCRRECEALARHPAKPPVGRNFRITGLCCAEEVASLNRSLGSVVGGADHLGFDVLNGRMTLLASAVQISDEQVLSLVAKTGMSAMPWDGKSAEADQAAHLSRQTRFTAASALFWGGGLAWHVAHSGAVGLGQLFDGHGDLPVPLGELGLFLVAVALGVWLVLPKALYALRNRSPDMNLLMVVAVVGAISLGEYFEAATVAFFFALSLTLESWSVGRARSAVSALLDLAPATARVVQENGHEVEMPAGEVQIGQHFVLRGGDRIPMDGRVIAGAGAVDQAPITGESALVAKEPGDEVYAGTLNGEGSLTVEATKLASDTVLAKITRMVGDAHARRAPVEQWV